MARYSSLRLTGLKEIKGNVAILERRAFNGDVLYQKMGDATEPLMEQAKRNVEGLKMNVTRYGDVANSVYMARREPPSRPRRKSVLVVVHKRNTYADWTAGKGTTSPRAKVSPGGAVRESIGTMLEVGTTRTWRNGPGIEAHFWFKRAVDSTKLQVARNLMQALISLIDMTSGEFARTAA